MAKRDRKGRRYQRRWDDQPQQGSCQIAGCIYSALYVVRRAIRPASYAYVCRKCCGELTSDQYNWKFIRTMTKEERDENS